MSRKRVALIVLTPRRRRQQQKRRRHNDDIHDDIHDEVENQEPSPHPISPIILPQAFHHAPNTIKPVCHIGAMINTSSTVLNFKTWFTAFVHAPKSKLYL